MTLDTSANNRQALIELPLSSFLPKSSMSVSPALSTKGSFATPSRSASPTKRFLGESPACKQRVAAESPGMTTCTPKAGAQRNTHSTMLSPGASLGISVAPTQRTTPTRASTSLLTPSSSSPSHRALFDAVRQSRASSYTTALEFSPALSAAHDRGGEGIAPPSPMALSRSHVVRTPKTPRAPGRSTEGLAPSPTLNYEGTSASSNKRAGEVPASLARKAVRVPHAEGRAHIGSPSPRRPPTSTYPLSSGITASPSSREREQTSKTRPTWLANRKEEENFVVLEDSSLDGSGGVAATVVPAAEGASVMLMSSSPSEEEASEAENDENVAPALGLDSRASTSHFTHADTSIVETPRASSCSTSTTATVSTTATPEQQHAKHPPQRRKGTGGRLSLLAAAGDESFTSSTSTAEAADKEPDTSSTAALRAETASTAKRERSRSAESELRVLGGRQHQMDQAEGQPDMEDKRRR